jgi:hypothetical protein
MKDLKDESKEVVETKKVSTLFREGQELYATAFFKDQKNVFYLCKVVVTQVPQANERRLYKVKIVSVAENAVGQKKDLVPEQASLLNRVITKRENELNTQVPLFMMPKGWITVQPK